jgi:hypothetical protein
VDEDEDAHKGPHPTTHPPASLRSGGCLLPGFQLQGYPGGDPAIEEDAHEQPEGTGEVAGQHVGQPVFTFEYTGVADAEDVKHAIYLKRDENPAIFPCPYRRRKAEEEQETIIGNIVFGVAGWEAFFWTVEKNMDVLVKASGTRAIDQDVVEVVEAAGYAYGCDNAERGLNPFYGRFASYTGDQADNDKANQPRAERDNGGERVVEGADEVDSAHEK